MHLRVYHEAMNAMLQLYTHHILYATCSHGTCECMHECDECMRTTILKPFHSYAQLITKLSTHDTEHC